MLLLTSYRRYELWYRTYISYIYILSNIYILSYRSSNVWIYDFYRTFDRRSSNNFL